MIFRMFILLIGFGLAVSGGVTLIAYLNIIVAGHNFANYIIFIAQRVETYLFLGGLLLIWLSIYFPDGGDESSHDDFNGFH